MLVMLTFWLKETERNVWQRREKSVCLAMEIETKNGVLMEQTLAMGEKVEEDARWWFGDGSGRRRRKRGNKRSLGSALAQQKDFGVRSTECLTETSLEVRTGGAGPPQNDVEGRQLLCWHRARRLENGGKAYVKRAASSVWWVFCTEQSPLGPLSFHSLPTV